MNTVPQNERPSLTLGALARAIDASHQGHTFHPGSLAILMLLAEMADEQGICEVRQPEIACWLQISIDSVKRHMRELRTAGLVQSLRRGNNRRTARYYVDAVPIARESEHNPCRPTGRPNGPTI